MKAKTFFIIALIGMAGLFCQPARGADIPPKFKSCYGVYKNLINAIGRMDPAEPTFVPRSSSRTIADTKSTGEIYIGEKFIDLCITFGDDSLNAMAIVLGHELAHHYGRHFWAKEFGSAYASLDWGQKMKSHFKDLREMGVLETQADEFGMFFSYVAGYNTFGLAPKLFKAIYETFGLKDSMDGYPPLQERIRISIESEARVRKLIPIFETGKLLSIFAASESGDYRQFLLTRSADCFEHIIDEKFTSREMYNNLGVTYLLKAFSHIDPEENPYQYPVMLDDQSKLYEFDEDGGKVKGSGGLGWSSVEVKEHLESAEKYFKHAETLDKEYLPPLINIAIIYELLEQFDDAEYYAKKALKLAEKKENAHFMAYAYETLGIINAHGGTKKDAVDYFANASKKGSILTEHNLRVLKNQPLISKKDEKIQLNLLTVEETIGDRSLFEIFNEMEWTTENVYKLHNGERILRADVPGANLYIVECNERDCVYNNLIMHQTTDEYKFSTARDINLYDPFDKVIKAYGKPTKSLPASGHNYYVFNHSNIIFKVNDDNLVMGWTIYFHQ